MAEVNNPAILSRLTWPDLEGARVAVQLNDGTLVEGYWYGGAVHDEPRKPSQSAYTLDSVFAFRNPLDMWRIRPNRLPAPWRIWQVNREWRIDKLYGDKYETWCRFDTSAQAYAAFAAGNAR